MTAAERRVDPLEEHAASPWRRRRPRAHRFHAPAKLRDDPIGPRLHAERHRDATDVREDLVEGLRLEVHHLRRSRQGGGEGRHALEADGTDVAQPLGDDDLRGEAPQQRLVHGVEGPGALQLRLHPAVDVGARQRVPVDRAAGDPRQPVHGGGVVALVAHAHQVVEHAERGDDLRRRRQERDDAHERVVAG